MRDDGPRLSQLDLVLFLESIDSRRDFLPCLITPKKRLPDDVSESVSTFPASTGGTSYLGPACKELPRCRAPHSRPRARQKMSQVRSTPTRTPTTANTGARYTILKELELDRLMFRLGVLAGGSAVMWIVVPDVLGADIVDDCVEVLLPVTVSSVVGLTAAMNDDAAVTESGAAVTVVPASHEGYAGYGHQLMLVGEGSCRATIIERPSVSTRALATAATKVKATTEDHFSERRIFKR